MPKSHYYDVLDGLRGTAALVILVFHYLEMTFPGDYVNNPLGHGFLAVDFFFCLSGFVIGFAYDDRIGQIGIKNFFINRLIRLHPLVIVGSIVGLAGFVLDPYVDGTSAGWGRLLLTFAASAILIPCPVLPFRDGALFPYNSPSWSLFLEYLANVVYAVLLCRLKKKMLLLLGCICALWLAYASYKAGWLINGWDKKTFFDGFPRVSYSFIAGLLVFRYKVIWENRFGFVLPFLLLMLVFFFPHAENDWFRETLLVVIGFPLIVCVGAGAAVSGRMKKLCIFMGKLSYPLYMTHIATVWTFGNYYVRYQPTGMKTVMIVSGLIIFNLLFAYAVMRLYDEPVRAWLAKKRKKSL
jgi:peptidoglycan/LPS O-acetylase OafA/YrhL